MRSVYIETTIPSYLAGRPSGSAITKMRQELTRRWWIEQRHSFHNYCSQYVLSEAAAGDKDAAARRLAYLSEIPLLVLTPEIEKLAIEIVGLLRLPQSAEMDAYHISMSIVYRVDYLLTWNCAHIANYELQRELAEFCLYRKHHTPVIVTPEQMLAVKYE